VIDREANVPEHNYAEAELLYNKFMEPALRAAVASLPLPRNNGRILDAGCGPGGVFPLLCKALGPTGQLVGIDFSEPHFAKAEEQIGKESSHKNVRIEKVNLMEPLPFPENHFDAVWAADVILPDDFVDAVDVVKRLVRVLCPGGILAIFYGNWLRPIFLPGYARLEHLICVAKELMYARDRGWDGYIHPERAELWLRQAGLTATRMDFFPVHYRQPLPNHVYEYVSRYSLREFYENAIRQYGDAVSLTAEDKVLWERLSDPASPDFILAQPDYYCAAFALLTVGQKPICKR
jgi:SAM-dependent methyltransferase